MGRNTLLSAGSTLTAAIALVLGVLAVATPYWATFTDNLGNEQGHFGAWTLCRERDSVYRCGPSRLRPSEYTAAAGVCGIVALLLTLVVCVMSPLVLAMRVTRRQLFVKFRHAVLAKLVISCVSVTCCMLTLILFGIDVDGQQLGQSTGFQVTRGWSYYLLVVYTLLSLSLTGFAAAEFVLARRLGGDPVKMSRDPAGSLAPVIVNPSVAKHHHQQHHQLQQLQLQHQLTAAPAAGSCSYSSNGHGNGCAVAVIGSSCPPAVVFQRVSAAAAGPLPHHATYSNQLATLDVKAAAAAAASAATSGGGSGGVWGGEAVDNERVTSRGWMTSSNIGETATATATATSAAVRQAGQPLAFDPRRQPLRSSMKKRPHATTTRDPATGTATATATGTNSNNDNDSSSCRMAYSVTFDTAPYNGNSNNSNSSNNINSNNNSNNNNNNNNSHIQFADEGVVIIPNRQAAVTAATVVVDAAVHDQLSPAVASYSSVHNSGGSIRSKKVRIQTLDTPV